MEKRRFNYSRQSEENIEPIDNDEQKERYSRKRYARVGIAVIVVFLVTLYFVRDTIVAESSEMTAKIGRLFGTISSDNLRKVEQDAPIATILPDVGRGESVETVISDSKVKEHEILKETEEHTEQKPNVSSESEEVVEQRLDKLIAELREMKRNKVVIEEDPAAKLLVLSLQTEARKLLLLRYGPEPYIVEMSLAFPSSMPDFAEKGAEGKLHIEMAPVSLLPYCVFNFLEIARKWQGGAFHRQAGHVLQAMVHRNNANSLAFQEYHPDFPHKRLTLGYAGRPGGPAFYISTVDNTKNHGPGSQGSKTEADGIFGKIAAGGADEEVVKRMMKQPGAQKPMGFVSSAENFIKIPAMRILTKEEAAAFRSEAEKAPSK